GRPRRLSHVPADVRIDSHFQRRMMTGDFAGDLDERLVGAAGETDVLLWDLADERHGVHVFDDGAVVTRSIDLVRAPEALTAVEDARHVPFGTDEHFELWAPRAEQLRGRLVELELFDKTLVLQVPWALVTVDGKHTPQSMGTTAMEANEAYRRYYEHLRGLGFRILELQPLGVLADPEHRWGLAPFHYTQDGYEEVVGRILAGLPARVTGEAAGAPRPSGADAGRGALVTSWGGRCRLSAERAPAARLRGPWPARPRRPGWWRRCRRRYGRWRCTSDHRAG